MSDKLSFLGKIIINDHLTTPPEHRAWSLDEYIEAVTGTARLGLPEVQIHNADKGGLLWVADRKSEFPMLAACVSTKEVALSRAIFNSRVLNIDGSRESLGMVAYEAPLLRRRDADPDAAQPSAKCDLVALTRGSKILLIEVKALAGKSTNLDYALLEGTAYCSILRAILAQEGAGALFSEELKSSIGRFHNKRVGPKLPTGRIAKSYHVQFAVAGPRGYYREQMDTARYRSSVEQVHSKLNGRDFFGFLVLQDNACEFVEVRMPNPTTDKTFYVPFLRKNECRLARGLAGLNKI